mmetsp:Transcript_51439/g.111987  ORF Transcript_51439/g.111987 Transcript_51439/m.111987 type:complete len:148 (-) Transcript_51439:54-497(-)
MVLKTTLCRFSGLRIYPGKGVLFIRTDSSQYLFLNKKCRSLFFNKKRPAKLAWTFAYRKAHKKDQVNESSRKKRRNTGKSAIRSIAGVSMEVINKKRTEKPEVRQASRDAALREIKDRAKKVKAERAAAAKSGSKAPVAKTVKGKGR